MRIMDAALILFRRPLNNVVGDPIFPCPVPSWSESLKVSCFHAPVYKLEHKY